MQTTEIPQFKLAKVGQSRERKKGAVWFWFGGGANLALKCGLALMLGTLSAGA